MHKTTIKIHIVDEDDCLPSIPISFRDHFKIATSLIPRIKYEITLESEEPKDPTNNVDYLILPPTISSSPPSQKAESLILAQNKKGTIIACCGGVLKLAHLGILNNREATTHWMFREEMERVSAEVKSTIHKTLVVDRSIVTTGGIQSYLDVICWIIKTEAGTPAAQKYNQFVQGSGIREFQIPSEEKGEHFLEPLFIQLDEFNFNNLDLATLAKQNGMSARTYQRYLLAEYGTCFRDALKAYRMKKIKKLIRENKPIKEISHAVGFQDDISLRRFFKKETKMPISKYRDLLKLASD